MTGGSGRSAGEGRFDAVPGWELVQRGIEDLAAERRTIEAALVASASIRLAELGITVPPQPSQPPLDLYDLVALDVGDRRAHGRYNAFRRRLASFLSSAANAPAD